MLLTAIFNTAGGTPVESGLLGIINEHNKRHHQDRVVFSDLCDYEMQVIGTPAAIMGVISMAHGQGFDCLCRVFPCKWHEN